MSAGRGFIEVGLSRDGKQVVINHPKIKQNKDGGYIVFSPQEAVDLAQALIRAANQATEGM